MYVCITIILVSLLLLLLLLLLLFIIIIIIIILPKSLSRRRALNTSRRYDLIQQIEAWPSIKDLRYYYYLSKSLAAL